MAKWISGRVDQALDGVMYKVNKCQWYGDMWTDEHSRAWQTDDKSLWEIDTRSTRTKLVGVLL